MNQGLAAPDRIRKGTATRLGVTLAEYDAHLVAGERWCCGHKRWELASGFPATGGYCRVAHAARTRRRDDRRGEEFRRWLLARVLVK